MKNRKKIFLKKIKNPKSEIEKYPLVSVEWLDILSNSSWQSIKDLKETKLATCITKGHLLSQSKGITRIFGDYSTDKEDNIEEIGNTTVIPNSVITNIKKI